MPKTREHRKQAEHNAAAQAYLDQEPSFADWSVTVLFYRALQHVDAYLAAKAGLKDIGSHAERESAILNHCARILTPYKSLDSRSREARYSCVPFSEQDVRDFEQRYLNRIKKDLEELSPGITAP